MESSGELALRELIMHTLAQRTAENSFVTSRELAAFDIGGETMRLIDRGRGIWNPAHLETTLTIISDPDSEYTDGEIGDQLYRYSYQKGSNDGFNTKLRNAITTQMPIVMFRKIANQKFVPIFPVYVVDDDPETRHFILALDESLRFIANPKHLTAAERRYSERIVKQRLHQPEFRAKVMRAYSTRCAVCSLKKGPLLDAAHIIGDAETDGLPLVANGLSLCKIHHAAYDSNYLGIRPDLVVSINAKLLLEKDGPMLKHGIQEMDGRTIEIPRSKSEQPDRDRLAIRYEAFQGAS